MQIDPRTDHAMRAIARRPTGRRPWLPLLSALMKMAGGQAELVRHNERNWASVTFNGTRHTVVLTFTGTEAVKMGETFTAALSDHEFALPRQIVADASIVRVDHAMLPHPRMEVEAELLLIEDC